MAKKRAVKPKPKQGIDLQIDVDKFKEACNTRDAEAIKFIKQFKGLMSAMCGEPEAEFDKYIAEKEQAIRGKKEASVINIMWVKKDLYNNRGDFEWPKGTAVEVVRKYPKEITIKLPNNKKLKLFKEDLADKFEDTFEECQHCHEMVPRLTRFFGFDKNDLYRDVCELCSRKKCGF